MLGGMMTAIEDAAATTPCANGSENFSRSIMAGIRITPSAATVAAPEPEIAAGDLLLCDLRDPRASEITAEFMLRELPLSGDYFSERSAEIGMAEIAILPESSLIGQTLMEAKFRNAFGLNAIGLRRNSAAVVDNMLSHRLRVGDILLVFGKWESIRRLKSQNRDFIILNLPEESEIAATSPGRAGGAIFSQLVMVALMATGAVEHVVAAAIC